MPKQMASVTAGSESELLLSDELAVSFEGKS